MIDSFRKIYATADRRTLGVFRIYFGSVLLYDLVRRWRHVHELYTDDGVLPVTLLRAHPQAAHQMSVYTWVTTPLGAHIAFALTALVYMAYVVGFRTRIAQLLSLLAVTGLDARNLLVENGGSVVLNGLATWTLLMPLGDRYSLDARRRNSSTEPSNAFTSMAVFGVLLQTVLIYVLNTVHKNGPTWKSGEAIHYVLWQNRVATPLAAWLRLHEPPWFSPIFTSATLLSEALIPLLLLVPWYRPFARTLAFGLAFALHGSIALLMRLGPFSYAMIGLVMLSIPQEAADVVEQNLHRWQSGSKNAREKARLRSPAPSRYLVALREIAAAALIVTVLSRVLVDDSSLQRFGARQPAALEAVALSLRLPQRWTMYAPDVPVGDGMIIVDAITESGNRIDPFTGEPPNFAVLDKPVPNPELMTNYLLGVFSPAGRPYQSGLRAYLHHWRRPQQGAPVGEIRSTEVCWVAQASPRPGSVTPSNRSRHVLVSWH